MTDLKNTLTNTQEIQKQPTLEEVQLSLDKFNTDFKWILLWFKSYVWNIFDILKNKKNPAEMIETLAQKRIEAMKIIWEETINDEEFLKNGTDVL